MGDGPSIWQRIGNAVSVGLETAFGGTNSRATGTGVETAITPPIVGIMRGNNTTSTAQPRVVVPPVPLLDPRDPNHPSRTMTGR
jgi:hypothetical protein